MPKIVFENHAEKKLAIQSPPPSHKHRSEDSKITRVEAKASTPQRPGGNPRAGLLDGSRRRGEVGLGVVRHLVRLRLEVRRREDVERLLTVE